MDNEVSPMRHALVEERIAAQYHPWTVQKTAGDLSRLLLDAVCDPSGIRA